VGVFFGNGRRNGKWDRENCIVVHVMRKVHALHITPRQRFPEQVAGYYVDVLEVGVPRTHSLDATDEVLAPGTRPRTGTFTALVAAPTGGVGLLSGHVTLPFHDAQIVEEYDRKDGDEGVIVTAVDGAAGRRFKGDVLRGGISQESDWSLVLFEKAKDAISVNHPLLGKPPPFARRRTPVEEDEPLQHFSRMEGGKVRGGRVQHVGLTDVKLLLPDRSERFYARVISVVGTAGPFSQPGDSGSLVCDARKRAVGTILGGAENGSCSYVVPVDRLEEPLEGAFAKFFQD
jgi:hypothetical protein